MTARPKPAAVAAPEDDEVEDVDLAVLDRRTPTAVRADALAGRVKNARGRRTKQKLIDAAIRCFSDYGYRRTRIQDIVFQAGVSQGSFYRHFTTKSELLLEALEPCLEELLTVTSGAGGGGGGGGGGGAPSIEGMTQTTNAYFTSYARNRLLLRLLREAAVIDAEFYERWQVQRQRFIGRTERWLERLHETGHIGEGNFPVLADVLGSTVEQTCYVHIGLPEQAPRQERIQELARTVAEVWFRSLPPLAPSA
jgi:AcrR family transcriptional regulator